MVMLAGLPNGEFNSKKAKLERVNNALVTAMKNRGISPHKVRNVLLSTLLAHIISHDTGPDKVKAQIWEA
jgi:hypothetical protein